VNIAICDDDKTIVKEVETLIRRNLDENIFEYDIYTFTSGKELLKTNIQFDIVYIDIEMPETNGLEVSRQILSQYPNTTVLIITSYPHHLDDAMEIKVYRYISKPFDEERFKKNLMCAYKHYLSRNKPIKIKSNDELSKINSSDIIYLSIENEKVYVHTYNDDIRTTENFNYWLKELDGLTFFQVHQSFIVNLGYVKKAIKGNALLICNDKSFNVPVSTRKYTSFKKALHKYIGGIK